MTTEEIRLKMYADAAKWAFQGATFILTGETYYRDHFKTDEDRSQARMIAAEIIGYLERQHKADGRVPMMHFEIEGDDILVTLRVGEVDILGYTIIPKGAFRVYEAAVKHGIPVVYSEDEDIETSDGRMLNVLGYMEAVTKGEL